MMVADKAGLANGQGVDMTTNGGPTPHEIPRTRSVLDAQAEQDTLSLPCKVSSD